MACSRTELLPGMQGSGGSMLGGVGGHLFDPSLGTGGAAPFASTSGTGGTTTLASGTGGAVPPSGTGGRTTLAGAGGSPATSSSPCPCSRRPGGDYSFQCPMGTGQSASADIGRMGGTVSLSGTPSTKGVPCRLDIPANALSQLVTVTITETDIPPPLGYIDESPIYAIDSPGGLALASPARLTIPFQSDQSSVSNQLAIYLSTDGKTFTRLSVLLVNAGFVQGLLRGTGLVFAGYPATPPCGG
jgi:hypothetical protein